MSFVNLLERLSNACGVAGREEEVRELMKELLKPNVDEVREDKLGNIVGVRRGRKDMPSIMMAAHMDEVGLMVKNITDVGFVQFAKIGGIDDRILVAQKVLIHTEGGPLTGIIGSKPPHILKEEEKKKVIEADELFIDLGASSDKEAREMGVRIGDPISFDIRFTKLREDVVVGKAFDDRVGCAVLAEVMEKLEKVDCTVYAVGTIQEEVGMRGATTAAFGLYPDVGIAVDVTFAGGVPGVKDVEAPIKMRKGPSLVVADRGLIAHPKVLRLLVDAAEELGIPYQLEMGSAGTTDAAKIALTREGIPSGVISIPTRYIHSSVSMLSLDDAENAIKLAIMAIKKFPKIF
ncbi:MAG: M42 family metallopeptidase [Candidatus Methylarchaceae archaeon HK02M1]|nr:M42 family metallopeptidase [Candidatus Methylarchaceae archaeon HK02M1]